MGMTDSVGKHGGEVLFPYDQSEDPRISGDYALKEGACLGLCIQWIIKRKEDRTGIRFWEWLVGQKDFSMGVVKYAMVKQATVISMAKFASGKHQDALISEKVTIASKELEKHAIHKASKTGGAEGQMWHGFSTELVGHMFVAQPGACCLLYMMGGGVGGHVVAFYCGVGDYYFFDPNCGEIQFKNWINFKSWLGEFWNVDSKYKGNFRLFILMYFKI